MMFVKTKVSAREPNISDTNACLSDINMINLVINIIITLNDSKDSTLKKAMVLMDRCI